MKGFFQRLFGGDGPSNKTAVRPEVAIRLQHQAAQSRMAAVSRLSS